jgi:hypothetical protein
VKATCKDHGGQYNIDCPSCIAARRPRRPEWSLKVSDCFVIGAVLLCVAWVILAVGPGEFVKGSLSILDLFLWLLRYARRRFLQGFEPAESGFAWPMH